MATKGYCTVDDVTDFLGRTLTAAQMVHCHRLIGRAENYIDEETHRGWLVGEQAAEAHYLDSLNSRLIYLRYAPVESVDAITARSFPGASEITLTANTDYEVRDPEGGLVVVIWPGSWDRILLDYTPVATVPGDIAEATMELTAAWLQPHLQPGSFGLDSYSLPDLTVNFARSHVQAAAPPGVRRIIEHYRYPVHA